MSGLPVISLENTHLITPKSTVGRLAGRPAVSRTHSPHTHTGDSGSFQVEIHAHFY